MVAEEFVGWLTLGTILAGLTALFVWVSSWERRKTVRGGELEDLRNWGGGRPLR